MSVQPLHDPNYRVVVQAVKLRRQVEMYQWVEQHESRYVSSPHASLWKNFQKATKNHEHEIISGTTKRTGKPKPRQPTPTVSRSF